MNSITSEHNTLVGFKAYNKLTTLLRKESESNWRHPRLQRGALPLSYLSILILHKPLESNQQITVLETAYLTYGGMYLLFP